MATRVLICPQCGKSREPSQHMFYKGAKTDNLNVRIYTCHSCSSYNKKKRINGYWLKCPDCNKLRQVSRTSYGKHPKTDLNDEYRIAKCRRHAQRINNNPKRKRRPLTEHELELRFVRKLDRDLLKHGIAYVCKGLGRYKCIEEEPHICASG